MKLTFLGSGSAFTVGANNYHSNMLLEDEDKNRLLIDCGSDIRHSLHEQNLSHKDIHDVYISHLHADHAGGLEWLAFNTKFDASCKKPNLYINEKMLDNLWKHVLAGGLNSLNNKTATLSDYFEAHPIKEDNFFIWQKLKIQIIQTIHVYADHKLLPSYGLLFTVNNLTVFITTDTQFYPDKMLEFYQTADIIFHDCETDKKPISVHSSYEDLLSLDEKIRNKMWLYHYNPGRLPDAKKNGFRGFVKKGQCFDFSDKNTL